MSQEMADDKYEPRIYSQDFSETITVLVGSDEHQQQFTIHKHLICAGSKFFNAACSKLWAEGKEKVVRLPEAKAEAFRAYIVWIYTGKVVVNKSDHRNEFQQTVELYLLGDVLDDLRLRNESMRTMCKKRIGWTCDLINQIWDSTAPNSRLRQMIVDALIMRIERDSLGEDVNYPKDLWQAVAVSLLGRLPIVPKAEFESGLEKYIEPENSDA